MALKWETKTTASSSKPKAVAFKPQQQPQPAASQRRPGPDNWKPNTGGAQGTPLQMPGMAKPGQDPRDTLPYALEQAGNAARQWFTGVGNSLMGRNTPTGQLFPARPDQLQAQPFAGVGPSPMDAARAQVAAGNLGAAGPAYLQAYANTNVMRNYAGTQAFRLADAEATRQARANQAWAGRWNAQAEASRRTRANQAWTDRLNVQAADYLARQVAPVSAATGTTGGGGSGWGNYGGGGGGGGGGGYTQVPEWYQALTNWKFSG